MQSFDFDMFASIDSFCIDRVASAEVRLVLAVTLARACRALYKAADLDSRSVC